MGVLLKKGFSERSVLLKYTRDVRPLVENSNMFTKSDYLYSRCRKMVDFIGGRYRNI